MAGKFIVCKKLPKCEALSLDPIFSRQVNRGECGQTAVSGTGCDQRIVWLCDGPRLGLDLSGKELIKGIVFARVRLFHLLHRVLQVEALDEGDDV
jgi:hypothetical protein